MFRGCHGVEYRYDIIGTNGNGTTVASILAHRKKEGHRRSFLLQLWAEILKQTVFYFRPFVFAFFLNMTIMQTFLGMMQFTNKFHKCSTGLGRKARLYIHIPVGISLCTIMFYTNLLNNHKFLIHNHVNLNIFFFIVIQNKCGILISVINIAQVDRNRILHVVNGVLGNKMEKQGFELLSRKIKQMLPKSRRFEETNKKRFPWPIMFIIILNINSND